MTLLSGNAGILNRVDEYYTNVVIFRRKQKNSKDFLLFFRTPRAVYWRWSSELSATTMFLSMRSVTLLSTSMSSVVSLISLTVP